MTPGCTWIVVWISVATPLIAVVNAVSTDAVSAVTLVTMPETCDTRRLTD